MLRPLSEPAHAFGNASAAVIPIVAAMTSPNRTVAVYKLVLTASAATNIIIQDTSGAALSQTIPLTGNKALVLNQLDDTDPWCITAAGLGVQLAQSGTANIGFDAYYLGGPFYTQAPAGGGGSGSGGPGPGVTQIGAAPMLSGSRAGVASVVVVGDGTGNARVISNIGSVT